MISTQIPTTVNIRRQENKKTMEIENKAVELTALDLPKKKTHSFRRCSKSPREEGMDPLILLLERSLRKNMHMY